MKDEIESIDGLFESKKDKKRAAIGAGIGLAGVILPLVPPIVPLVAFGYAGYKTFKKSVKIWYDRGGIE